MWTINILNTDLYHLLASFVLYSILGWCVESIYMSLCNKKITNRGFAKSPFCPIYGFGATIGYFLLSPFKGQYLKIYIIGAITATIFEFIVGKGMIFLLGELWWDYNKKILNFQGIICLESTLAWGVYALGIVHILHAQVYRLIDMVDVTVGIRAIRVVLLIVAIDYVIQLLHAFKIDVKAKKDQLRDYYYSLIIR